MSLLRQKYPNHLHIKRSNLLLKTRQDRNTTPDKAKKKMTCLREITEDDVKMRRMNWRLDWGKKTS